MPYFVHVHQLYTFHDVSPGNEHQSVAPKLETIIPKAAMFNQICLNQSNIPSENSHADQPTHSAIQIRSVATNLLLVDNVPKTTANRQCYLRANDMFFQVIA